MAARLCWRNEVCPQGKKRFFEAYNKSNRHDEACFVLEKLRWMTEGQSRMKESNLALKKTTSMADKTIEAKRWLRWSR